MCLEEVVYDDDTKTVYPGEPHCTYAVTICQ